MTSPHAQLTGPTVLPLELRKQTAILQFLSSRLGQASIGLTNLRITNVNLCPTVNGSTAGACRAHCYLLIAYRNRCSCIQLHCHDSSRLLLLDVLMHEQARSAT